MAQSEPQPLFTRVSPQNHHFGVTRRKVDVKLRPNFTSKRAFLEAKKQAFLMRRMLIIRHKHSQVGWWGVRKNSVKLKKQVLMEFGGWSLPPWPKSLIGNRFPCSYRPIFTRQVDTGARDRKKWCGPSRHPSPKKSVCISLHAVTCGPRSLPECRQTVLSIGGMISRRRPRHLKAKAAFNPTKSWLQRLYSHVVLRQISVSASRE